MTHSGAETETWSSLPMPKDMGTRYDHNCVAFSDLLIIYGGRDQDDAWQVSGMVYDTCKCLSMTCSLCSTHDQRSKAEMVSPA